MKLLSGSSNPDFAKQLAQRLGIDQVEVELTKFANGEKRVWIKDGASLKGQNVILAQSLTDPVDEHLMELLLMADALERLGTRHVNAVIPWMGYSFQDKAFREGEPISAKVVANLISNSYIKRVFLLDLHNPSIPGFFSIPTHYLTSQALFLSHVRQEMDLANAIVASPDFGGLKRSRTFAQQLDLDLINVNKHRDLRTGQVTAVDLKGDVTNKDVLLFDDAILSGGTVVEVAALLKERGAKSVTFFAAHGLFVGDAIQKLTDSEVDRVVTTNSVASPTNGAKFNVLSAADVFGPALESWL